jgi:ribose transport system permease protein
MTQTQAEHDAPTNHATVTPGLALRSLRPRSLLLTSVERFSGVYAFVAVFILFAVWVPDTFLTSTTLKVVLAQQSVTALVALGLMIPLAAGVFDLSIGGVLGLSVMFCAWLQGVKHMNPALSVVLTLLLGVVVGAVNAIAVLKFRVSSFIATLGMSSVLGAMVVAVSGNQQLVSGISANFQKVGNTEPGGIPIVAYYMVVVAIVLWFVLELTPVGRYLFAVGGNQEAARLGGLRTERYIGVSLVLSAVIAAAAGVIYLAQIGSASLSAGPPFLLPCFAAVFLGATQIRPGRFNVIGTLLAVFLLAVGVKGLQLVGVPTWAGDLFNGAALIIAVGLSRFRKRKSIPIS